MDCSSGARSFAFSAEIEKADLVVHTVVDVTAVDYYIAAHVEQAAGNHYFAAPDEDWVADNCFLVVGQVSVGHSCQVVCIADKHLVAAALLQADPVLLPLDGPEKDYCVSKN